MERVVVWFSCGAASAVAGALALEKYEKGRTSLVYCDTMASEHPDNRRFMADVERWLGVKVTTIRSTEYATIDDVFEKTRYMAGIAGARCTVEMKKRPRYEFQAADDIHVFGLTAEETDRIDRLVGNNPELSYDWILRDRGVTKRETLYRIEKAGIELPAMYRLGFKNNNCLGCVKATSISYWRRIRECFPEVFARRAKQSRDLDVRLVRLDGVRIFLDEIPHDELSFAAITENVSCGPECAED